METVFWLMHSWSWIFIISSLFLSTFEVIGVGKGRKRKGADLPLGRVLFHHLQEITNTWWLWSFSLRLCQCLKARLWCMKYFYRTFLTGGFRIGDHQIILFKEHLPLIRAVSFELDNSYMHIRECPEGIWLMPKYKE